MQQHDREQAQPLRNSPTYQEMPDSLAYNLGCPAWADASWTGTLFTRSAKKDDFLPQYSSVFNTVEGNTTFYATPTADKVRTWANDAAPGFRFALKFPKAISHERQLLNAEAETAAFLELLDILEKTNRLGPSFLQLGPNYSYQQFDALANYLQKLPKRFPYALEVRHRDFYDGGRKEQALDSLLVDLKIDKVLFDSRPLFSAPPTDDYEAGAQQRKPKTPIRYTLTGTQPMLRIIGRNQLDLVQPWLDEWAPIVAKWIADGLKPYVFLHTPDDLYAPELARRFHTTLLQCAPQVGTLPPFPSEREIRQRELF